MKPLNILFVLHEGTAGGASRFAIDLATEYIKKGHKVCALVPRKQGDVCDKLRNSGVSVVTSLYFWWQYPSRTEGWRQLIFKIGYRLNPILYKIAYLKLRKCHFDIIHTNSSVISFGAWLSERFSAKHVWHFHEFGEPDLGTKYIRGKKESMEFVNAHSDKVLFVSNSLYNYYKDYIDRKLCRVVYNGLPDSFIYKKQPDDYCRQGTTRFLISGAMQPGKGQRLAIIACSKLKQSGLANFTLTIAGRSISGYDKVLKACIEENGVSDIVNIVGFTEDIKTLRVRHDVELVCSDKEAFGYVTIEAMISGNPVIASAAGGSVELISNGETGILFTPGDARALADSMNLLIGKKADIAAMGEKARAYASNNFTLKNTVSNIEQIYYELLR